MGDIINIDDFFSKMTEEQATEFLMKAMKNLKLGEKIGMEEYFSDITDYFKTIFKELKIEKVEEFEFVEYDYPRLVIINGEEYDLDGAFNRDTDAKEALYAIDSLTGDLVCEFGMTMEQVLKLVEKKITE
ncbi:MAG: hypothetical protein IKC01_06740 [Clostridia bacterium]|nr:hypothetical protein [Clostridia bacterium]